MPKFPNAAFFDVDGVLVDSLPQHLRICRDKAAEFGLNLKIPTVEEFRDLVRAGVKVSPMRLFFSAVGFPEYLLDRAVADYEREFSQRYRPMAFPGVDQMLKVLRTEGVHLGLITSNIRSNVAPALSNSMAMFDERCFFFFDRYRVPRTKAWCLTEGMRILEISTADCVYVGDQPEDARAAFDAGAHFVGVTYGWGISDRDKQYRSANSILEIPDKLLELYVQSGVDNSPLAGVAGRDRPS